MSNLPTIEVRTDGHVPADAVTYATHRLEKALGRVELVRFARIRLAHAENPSHTTPASVRLEVDLDGEVFHAHADAPTFTEGVDLATERFKHELEHARSRILARQRRGTASPAGEWRHGDQPTASVPEPEASKP